MPKRAAALTAKGGKKVPVSRVIRVNQAMSVIRKWIAMSACATPDNAATSDQLDDPHERDDDEHVARGGAGSLVGLRGRGSGLGHLRPSRGERRSERVALGRAAWGTSSARAATGKIDLTVGKINELRGKDRVEETSGPIEAGVIGPPRLRGTLLFGRVAQACDVRRWPIKTLGLRGSPRGTLRFLARRTGTWVSPRARRRTPAHRRTTRANVAHSGPEVPQRPLTGTQSPGEARGRLPHDHTGFGIGIA